MRISDWSSDVCSSDLRVRRLHRRLILLLAGRLCHLPPLTQRFQHAGRLAPAAGLEAVIAARRQVAFVDLRLDRKGVVKGKRVTVRIVLGCVRIIKKKIRQKSKTDKHTEYDKET